MTRVLFLVNPRSGQVAEEGLDAVRNGLRSVLKKDASPEFLSASVPELREAARTAKTDFVASVGGDGTIGAVAGVLAGRSDAPCFVPLPFGTANLIPRDLGMPMDPVAALEMSLAATSREVDYATANGAPLLHSAVFGTFAEVAEERERAREAHDLGERLAALGAATGALFGTRPQDYHLVIDGKPLDATTNTVFVTNNAITGGHRGVPQRARLDSGHLVAYVSDSRSPFGFIQRIIEAGTRGFERSDGITRHLCRRVVVSGEGALTYSRDGEVEETDEVVFEAVPGALRVPDLRG